MLVKLYQYKTSENRLVFVWHVGGSDAPLLGVEVVGSGADILHHAERMALEGDGDDAARGVGVQCQGFAAQVSDGLRV